MATTREPDYPAEYAQLANAFMQCADGYPVDAVLNAAAQAVAAAIGVICKSRGCTLEQAEGYAEHIFEVIGNEVRSNWDRKAQASDVIVKSA